MSRKLFLVSDFTDNFSDFAVNFIEACGGSKANIAYLMQGEREWEQYFQQYEKIFLKTKKISFFPVFPSDDFEFEPEMIKKLKKATGIFVGGGHTFRFIRAYVESELSPIIKEKYNSGIPYAGLSAGAIITLRFRFLRKIVLKPHFTQQNRFFQLQKKIRNTKARFGLGLDDGIWLEIEDENEALVCGKGGCYYCRKNETDDFEFKIYHPGDKISFKKDDLD